MVKTTPSWWSIRLPLLAAYIALSVLFWLQLVPTPPRSGIVLVSTLAGPPAMLLWGRDALILFAVAPLLIFFLLHHALRFRRYYRLWFGATVIVWLASGFLSYAISI